MNVILVFAVIFALGGCRNAVKTSEPKEHVATTLRPLSKDALQSVQDFNDVEYARKLGIALPSDQVTQFQVAPFGEVRALTFKSEKYFFMKDIKENDEEIEYWRTLLNTQKSGFNAYKVFKKTLIEGKDSEVKQAHNYFCAIASLLRKPTDSLKLAETSQKTSGDSPAQTIQKKETLVETSILGEWSEKIDPGCQDDPSEQKATFNPNETGFNLTQATLLAKASEALLVEDNDEVSRIFREWGFASSRFLYFSKSDSSVFYAKHEDFILVVFRGSESEEDWSHDFDFSMSKALWLNAENSRIHTKFLATSNTLWQQLQNVLKLDFPENKKPIFFTGFREGGPLAVLSGLKFYQVFGIKPTVYTFGSPRFVDQSFVQVFSGERSIPIFRVEQSSDIMTHMPPLVINETLFRDLLDPIIAKILIERTQDLRKAE